jgi:hypothetical protein
MSTQDAQPVLPEPGEWAECLRISELPEIDEALRLFAEGETSEDQAVCIVRAIRNAALAAQQAAEPVKPLGYLNAGHIHEMQQGRLPYAYLYPAKEVGASVPVYTHAPATLQAEPVEYFAYHDEMGLVYLKTAQEAAEACRVNLEYERDAANSNEEWDDTATESIKWGVVVQCARAHQTSVDDDGRPHFDYRMEPESHAPATPQAEPVAVFDEVLGRPKLMPNAPILQHGDNLYTATSPPPVQPQGELIAPDAVWLIHYDDADKPAEILTSEVVARTHQPESAQAVAAQSRFSGVAWGPCDVEHARMVQANPSEWPGYEVRFLFEQQPAQVVPEGLSASILDALRDGLSVCMSVTMSCDRKIVRDGCTLFAQTEEWCQWAEAEVGPKISAAIDAAASQHGERK